MHSINVSLIWAAFVTFIIFSPQLSESQCQKINNCKCKHPTGEIIDLSSIGNPGGNTPKFGYAPPADEVFGIYEYSFNGCHGYSDEFCSGVVACQRFNTLSTPGFPLGTPDSADYTDGTLLKFAAYDNNAQQQRYTEVTLICDPNGKPDQPSLKVLGEPLFDWAYKYELTSKCACPNGCSGGGGGLSVGSILCIVFSVLVVVYIVGGIIFMKFGKGAEGKKVIPNYDVWIQMPGLVKDGSLYAVSFVKPGGQKSEYEDI